MRVRLCCGFWLGGGSQKPPRPNQSVYKNGWPLLPLQHSKKSTDAATQSLSRIMLEKRGQEANFGWGQNLPFWQQRKI
jgi:hypothetical protein